MMRHLYHVSLLTCEYVEPPIILGFQVLTPHECPDFGISINDPQLVPIPIPIIVQVDYVVSGTSLVLFASLVHLSSHYYAVLLKLIMFFHLVPSTLFTLESLLTQIVKFIVFLVNLSFPDLSIGY